MDVDRPHPPAVGHPTEPSDRQHPRDLAPPHEPVDDERPTRPQGPRDLNPPAVPDTLDEPAERVELPPMQRVDDAFPGLYDRSDCHPPTDVDPLCPPTAWVTDRNPGYPEAPGRDNNCGDCARASELTWRGTDTQAGVLTDPHAPGETLAVMDAWTEGDRTPTTFDDIEDRLEALGRGSSAIVGVYWVDGGGHWFNAFNDDDVVVASDGQKGECEPWPPTRAGLEIDEAECEAAFAIFIDSEGRHLKGDPLEEG
jgi:hypothetical protein